MKGIVGRVIVAVVAVACLAAATRAALAGGEGVYEKRYFLRSQGKSWHSGWYDPWVGRPMALVVPPTAEFTTEYGWGVPSSRVAPIYHQYRRPYPGRVPCRVVRDSCRLPTSRATRCSLACTPSAARGAPTEYTRNIGILPIFAWRASARWRGGRHPGGQRFEYIGIHRARGCPCVRHISILPLGA